MVRLFENRAEWFVGAGWLLLVIAILLAQAYAVSAGMHLGYFPQSENAPFLRSVLYIANAAMLASFVAALAPSVAFGFNFRVTASALAVGFWILITAAFLLLEFLGLHGIQRLTGLGPEQIERTIGSQRFAVPQHYRPTPAEAMNLPGFGFWVCGSKLAGGYDKHCRGFTQVTVSPAETGFDRQYDVSFWRDRLPEMKAGEIRSGHQGYAYATAPDDQGQTATTRYFVRQTPEGRLLRLVACTSFGHCRHHARVADYTLSYDAAESTLADWEAKDRELTALIDSWRK